MKKVLVTGGNLSKVYLVTTEMEKQFVTKYLNEKSLHYLATRL